MEKVGRQVVTTTVKSFENIVKIQTFGNINKVLTQKLLGILVECYERPGPPMTFSVNLNIYETSSGLGFFASHDALEGKPTINIYLDRFSGLPPHVAEAGVRRQAAHSILHGSPEYYKIKFPSGLRQAMRSYSFPESLATEILYGMAMAAKEYAVTRFLVEGGYIEDQVAYAKYMLEPTIEELQAWEIAKPNPTARIIYLTMTLRDISCAAPILKKPEIADEIRLLLGKGLSRLPDQYKTTVQRILEETIHRFSNDTFKNIENLVEAVVENIIHKELGPQDGDVDP